MKDYVYILLRDGVKSAKIVYTVRVYNARLIEKRMHEIFGCSRFTMSARTKPGKYMQEHVKIGIAGDPKKRLEDINQNFTSGKTEWFAMTGLEIVLCIVWLHYFSYRYLYSLLVFVIVVLYISIYYYTGMEKEWVLILKHDR